MIDFCLGLVPQGAQPPICPPATLAAAPPHRTFSLQHSGSPQLRLDVFWSPSFPFERDGLRVRCDDRGLRLLIGYPLSSSGQPVLDVDQFEKTEGVEFDGDFLHFTLPPEGPPRLVRSAICNQRLFLAEHQGRQALATRPFLAFAAVRGNAVPEADPEFFRWACSYAVGGSSATALRGVRAVLANESIAVGERIEIAPADMRFLQDENLRASYARNPKLYWDETYERLRAGTAALGFADGPIEFPLSGGKDSRLLLGLILQGSEGKRIERVFTNGPPLSPEVRAAALVCEALGLRHETVDRTLASTGTKLQLDTRLPLHLHITECEMSPFDLTWNSSQSRITQLHGQDGGLREIAGHRNIDSRTELLKWFAVHLANGDRCGLFRSGVANVTLDEISSFVDRALAAGIPCADIPSLHRVIYRTGRWVGRTWRAYNDRYFAPYIFIDPHVIRATFNSGAASRQREDFHFEMLRRVDPALVTLPFAFQTWPRETAERAGVPLPEPLVWHDAPTELQARPMASALARVFPMLQTFMRHHHGPASDALVDRDRLAAIDFGRLHPATHQSLWQVAQMMLLERIPDLSVLSAGVAVTDYGVPSFDHVA
jgi:hypothetical protein